MQNTSVRASKFSVAVVGGTGYSGQELIRLLKHHPHAEVTGSFNSTNVRELKARDYHAIFLATPLETSLALAPEFLKQGAHVIDLSGAFRLPVGQITANYQTWYKVEHSAPELVMQAHYGLVPWKKALSPKTPQLVANPGCYASAVLLALLPLLQHPLIRPESVVIDAKSGTTGAGKKAEEALLFSEVDGECLPYKIGTHQHLPEITQWCQLLTQTKIDPIFTTHLLPTRRGIIAGVYARLLPGKGLSDVQTAFHEAYHSYPLVQHGETSNKKLLSLKSVVGTAMTHIAYQVTGDKLHVFATLDNLLKGAASQAIENFNALADLPVNTGLTHLEALT